jgi:homoserine kinase type II
VEREGFSLGLYPFVDGDLLDVADAGQVEAAGRMLATLHEALAAYPPPFGDGQAEPNQQLIHGDFRSANILQDSASITAILDFDDVSYRSKVADLAKAAVLLGTRYHDWRPTSLDTRNAFLAAYDDVAPLTSVQRDELQHGVTTVLNHFGWT